MWFPRSSREPELVDSDEQTVTLESLSRLLGDRDDQVQQKLREKGEVEKGRR